MNPTSNTDTSGTNTAVCPLTSLVLLAATHHPDDANELLKPLGICETQIEQYAAENADEMETIRKTAIAGALLDRKTFASLIRVRVSVKLIETEDPRQLAPLVTAAAKLPPWVFGEEEPAVKQASNNTPQNGANPEDYGDEPDISTMGMQEAISEAKSLLTELEKPGKENLP